ncbi:unnamed protein product [Closterium sp. Naga37s-1]|nr:unnamed protein product [Closterium sp. Naga37s-1]
MIQTARSRVLSVTPTSVADRREGGWAVVAPPPPPKPPLAPGPLRLASPLYLTAASPFILHLLLSRSACVGMRCFPLPLPIHLPPSVLINHLAPPITLQSSLPPLSCPSPLSILPTASPPPAMTASAITGNASTPHNLARPFLSIHLSVYSPPPHHSHTTCLPFHLPLLPQSRPTTHVPAAPYPSDTSGSSFPSCPPCPSNPSCPACTSSLSPSLPPEHCA